MRAMVKSIVFAFVCVAGTASSFAGSTVTLGSNIPAAEQIPLTSIDYAQWNRILQKYVSVEGMVDYHGWQKSPADMRSLDKFLGQLSKANLSAEATKADKLAFWINAYNAVTVKGILQVYPTSSIRNHTAKLYGYNIWNDLLLLVGGKPFSLNQMEHKVLRKMGEPRIHFAIVCASIGCPRLLNEAYVPAKIDEQLTANSKAFFADPSKFQYDVAKKTIAVSPILDWYAEDFGKTTAEQMRRIAPFTPAAAQDVANSGEAKVSYLDYNWDLNDQAKK